VRKNKITSHYTCIYRADEPKIHVLTKMLKERIMLIHT